MPSRFLVEREENSDIPQSKIRDFRQPPLGKGARLWCRQSRRIKINRADDIRPYGQYITFSYSIVGGGASTPRKNFPLSTFIFQLSIVHCQLSIKKRNGISRSVFHITVEFLPFWASSLLHCATGRRRTGRQMPDPSPRHGSLRPGLQSRLQ